MDEKVSVLIPVYNREKYVEEAVRSIMNQTYKNLDILIYNDGSTDNTLQIIMNLAKGDKRITVVTYSKNHGGVYAKCQLLDICNTDIVCYQDSDDVSDLTRIEKQVNTIITHHYDASFCKWNWLKYDKNKCILKNMGNTKGAGTVMFRFDKNILPSPKFVLGGGDVEWIERYLKVHFNYIEIPEVLYHIRRHEDRIGNWKRKIRNKVPKELIKTLSYSELIKYYKEHNEK